jgi:CBS-domain-containing membrane protein
MKRWYVGDVMTVDVVTVSPEMGYKAVADLLVERSVSAVPVVNASGIVVGVVSEADLLAKLEYADRVPRHPLSARRMRYRTRKATGDTAAELMTAPAVTVRATETVTRAARLMEAAGIKRLLVVDDNGRLAGIVSRRDLLRLYTRSDAETLAALHDGMLHSLWIDPSTLDMRVVDGIVTLAGQVDKRSTAAILVAFALGTPGVVDVVDRLDVEVDDTPRHGRALPVRAEPEDVEIG